MWHVSSRSGVATLRTAIHLLFTYLLTYYPSLFVSLFLPLLSVPSPGYESGDRYSSPSGSGRSPAAKRIFVRFTAQHLQVCDATVRPGFEPKLGVLE